MWLLKLEVTQQSVAKVIYFSTEAVFYPCGGKSLDILKCTYIDFRGIGGNLNLVACSVKKSAGRLQSEEQPCEQARRVWFCEDLR